MGCTLLALYLAASLPAGQDAPRLKPITVSAAISLTDALTAVAEAYARTGGTVRFNFGASNLLARQIVSGAPVDLFVRPDGTQMDVVAAAGPPNGRARNDLPRNQRAVPPPRRP